MGYELGVSELAFLAAVFDILDNCFELAFSIKSRFRQDHFSRSTAKIMPFLEGVKGHPATPIGTNPAVYRGNGETGDTHCLESF